MNMNGTGSPMDNHTVIKDETLKRSSCPYTNEDKQSDVQSSANGVEGEKSSDGSSRSLSPEFPLGSSEESEQKAKGPEGLHEFNFDNLNEEHLFEGNRVWIIKFIFAYILAC
jgi:hypothetical protein